MLSPASRPEDQAAPLPDLRKAIVAAVIKDVFLPGHAGIAIQLVSPLILVSVQVVVPTLLIRESVAIRVLCKKFCRTL